jgi:hypothetical protein
VQLEHLRIKFLVEELNIEVEHPSPLVEELVALASDFLGVLRTYDQALAAVVQGILLGDVNDQVNEAIAQSASNVSATHGADCPPRLGTEIHWSSGASMIDEAFATRMLYGALALGTLSLLFLTFTLARRLSEEPVDAADSPSFRTRGRTWSTRPEWTRWWLPDALSMSPAVSPSTSVWFPLLLCACIFFLLASNYLLMAESFVTLEMHGDGEEPAVMRVFQVMVYGLFYSIYRLYYEQNSTALALLLTCFSGLLPYAKLIGMLVAWVVPRRVMSNQSRGTLLLVLDQIGKFSLIDVFVIQIISAAMHVALPMGNETEVANVMLRTNQEVGFVAFVLATVLSLCCGHFALFKHEQDPVTRLEHSLALRDRAPQHGAELRALLKTPCTLQEIELLLTGKKRTYVAPVLVLTSILTILGCCIPSFRIELSTPIAGATFSHEYSLVSFAQQLPYLSQWPNAVSTRFCQATFYFFVIFFCNLHLAILMVVWLIRIPPEYYPNLNFVAHSAFAWSALDVAVFALYMTLAEMTTSDFVPVDPDVMNRFLPPDQQVDAGDDR